MEPDIEAIAEAPRAIESIHMSSELANNSVDITEMLTMVPLEHIAELGIRPHNTNQTADVVRDSSLSLTDTERRLADSNDEARLFNGVYENTYLVLSWCKTACLNVVRRFSVTPPTSMTEKELKIHKKRGYNQLKDPTWEHFPTGIEKFARFQNSHEDFAIFRRFDLNHIRILDHLMIKLTRLERQLLERDKKAAAMPEEHIKHKMLKGARVVSIKRDGCEPELVECQCIEGDGNNHENHEEVEDKLLLELMPTQEQYDRMIIAYKEISCLPRPTSYKHLSVFNWFRKEYPLTITSREFMCHSEDFAYVKPRHGENPISQWFDAYLYYNPNSILKLLLKEDAKGDEDTNYYSDLRTLIVTTLCGSIIAGMFLIPICLLFLVSMSHVMMTMVVFVFVILAFVLITATLATQLEAFMATAAYCAVLVAFLGNLAHG